MKFTDISYIFLLFLIKLIICQNLDLYGQDVHYSQRLVQDRERNATFLNNFEGKWQAYTAYRQQWGAIGTPFTTSTAAISRKVYTPISGLKGFANLNFTNDESGDGKLAINRPGLVLGAEYTAEFGVIEFGVSNHYVAKSFNQNRVTFPAQYDRNTGGFNESLANGESLAGEQYGFYNLSVGLAFTKTLAKEWKLRSGFSLNNITEPQESFFDEENRKNRGYGLQFLAGKVLKPGMELKPYLSYYRAKGASETILGSAIALKTSSLGPVDQLQPFLYFRTGIDRLSDAAIIGSRAQLGNFDFGISYDVNISELEVASNYQGGFELSLFYTVKEKQIQRRRIPCVRY